MTGSLVSPMAVTSTLAAIGVFSAVLAASTYYLEYKAPLRLPGASFKPIGPHLQHFVLPAENEGVFQGNHILHEAERMFEGDILGSESVAVGPSGDLFMLDRYGTVFRAKPGPGAQLERLAFLGPGRPLGFHFDKEGNLIICSAGTGLQKLDMESLEITLLATEAPTDAPEGQRRPIRYANDLAIASDGSIYFTDSADIGPALNAAGFYDTMIGYLQIRAQGEATGRLLRYDPATRRTTLIADNLYFPNGVAVAEDASFVLVVETINISVKRFWLKGPKAGEQEVLLQPAPGYIDGLTSGSNGTFWIAQLMPRQPAFEAMMHSRFLRWFALTVIIPHLRPPSQRGSAVIQTDAEGQVLRYVADVDGSHITSLSAVTETPEGLFFGNLGGDYVSFLSSSHLPPLQAGAAGNRAEL